MHSSIETAPPCKILEQSDHLFMDILDFKDLGNTNVISDCSLGTKSELCQFGVSLDIAKKPSVFIVLFIF